MATCDATEKCAQSRKVKSIPSGDAISENKFID
jgi:hypothetical protein